MAMNRGSEQPQPSISNRRSDRSAARERAHPTGRAVGKDRSTAITSGHIEIASSQQRVAELEQLLEDTRAAATRQLQDAAQDAATFSRTIERLAYSERVVSQTTTKLVEAEEQRDQTAARYDELSARVDTLLAERELLAASVAELRRELDAANARELETRRLLELSIAEKTAKDEELEAAHEWTSRALAQEKSIRDLAESLSHDLAAGASECAKLQENCQAAELSEQQAVARALEAESAYANSLLEMAEWKTLAAELGAQKMVLEQELERARAALRHLRTKLEDGEQELSHTRERLEDAEHERERFLGIIERVAALSHEILEVGLEARTLTHEPEHERVTLVPGRPTGPVPRLQTDSTAPEILVDGVELGSTFTKS